MLEAATDAGLLEEAPHGAVVGSQVLAQELQCDLAAERGIAGPVDDPHPAARDLGLDAADPLGGDTRVRREVLWRSAPRGEHGPERAVEQRLRRRALSGGGGHRRSLI